MKKNSRLILSFALFVISMVFVQCGTSNELVVSDGLRFNESTLPYGDALLVANFGCEQLNPLNTDGKGYISIYKDGKLSTFIPNDGALSAPKGMLIKDNHLLICDVNKVVVYDLGDLGRAPQVVRFPDGELFVNDIVSIGDEVFVSVTNSGNIFKLDGSDVATISMQLPYKWFNIVGANGLAVDDNALFVASYPADGVTTAANVIYVIEDVNSPVAFMLTTKAGQWDGLAVSDDKKTLYASSWSPAEVVAISLESGDIQTLDIATEFVGAADFSLVGDTLYIPDLPNSKLIIVKDWVCK